MLKLNKKSNLDNKHRLGVLSLLSNLTFWVYLGCSHLITFNVTLDRIGFQSIIWHLLSNCSDSYLFPLSCANFIIYFNSILRH